MTTLLTILTVLSTFLTNLESKTMQSDFTVTVAEEINAPMNYPGSLTMHGERIDVAVVEYDLFADRERMDKEKRAERAALEIMRRMGKNAILRGMDLEEGATTIERNGMIGGHRA